jgi:F0F1-type ATP synthase membrane subunit b/b'
MYGPWIQILVIQAIFFIVVVVVLKRILLSDTMQAVQKVRRVEAEVSKKEEAIRRRMEENEQEFARKTAEAQEEARKAREASEKELVSLRASLLEESKKERDRIIADAEKHKERMRQELLRDVDNKAVEYAGAVFELVFSEQIGASLNQSFIDELLAALEDVDGDSIAVEAREAEFVASHALTPEQRARITDIVGRKFHIRIEVKEVVDPTLIAGLKIKLGSLEIDGSLLNRFREAIEEVRKKGGV